jgi:hypothetical protein
LFIFGTLNPVAMRLHVYLTTILSFSLCIMLAQPTQRALNGCHHTRNKAGKLKELTLMEKQLLNESIARSDTFDIVKYTIAIDVTAYNAHQISAATTIEFAPLMENQSQLRLDLYNLTVDSIKQNDASLTYAYDGNILTVNFPENLIAGDTTRIITYYHGEPYQDPVWGGFYFESNYIYNLGIGLSTIPPNFGRVWYPCFDSFVERATYEYHVKSAGAYRAHCQGTFLGETTVAGDTVIRSFAFNQPIPTHLSAIAVAAYQNLDYVHTGAFGEVPVRLTAKAPALGAMQSAMVNVGGAIDALEYWFGPYAWERVGYILTTDGALEIPTNIAYPQYMVDQSIINNNNLLSHELGHHWWGDIVTPHIHNDMWLKEGPAEYSSHLLTEWLYGQEDFVDQVKTNQLDVLRNAHIDDGDFYALSPMPDPVIYGTHTYYKGASVMHNLRAYMGDELFRTAMTAMQTNHMYEDVTPEQFRDYLEEAAGLDLTAFFEDQVYQPGFSVMVVDSAVTSASDNGFDVAVYIQQKLRECPQYYQQVPLDITLVSADNVREEFQVEANGQFTSVNLNCSFEPAMVILNGHNRLNQARMDHEFTVYSDQSLYPVLPYVDFRFSRENVVDSSLIRIEHIWAAPDQQSLGEGIFEISGTHYYTVDGLWDEGDFYTGRIYYNGSQTTDLDFALYNQGEEQAVLLYRPNASVAWEIYPDFTLGSGTLANGDGSFVIDTLRRGQYAFANGDVSVALKPAANESKFTWSLFPNPAADMLTVSGHYPSREVALFDIYSTNGRLLQRSSGYVGPACSKAVDVSSLSDGQYVLQVYLSSGEILSSQQFQVMR